MAVTKNNKQVRVNGGNNVEIYNGTAWISLGNVVSGKLTKKGDMLSQQTFEDLLLFDKRLIASVRCDSFDFVHQKTRSERVRLKVTTLASSVGPKEPTYQLTCFTQDNPIMEVGKSYLIAAYDNGAWTPAWTLVEAVPIDSSQAPELANYAAKILGEKEAKNKK